MTTHAKLMQLQKIGGYTWHSLMLKKIVQRECPHLGTEVWNVKQPLLNTRRTNPIRIRRTLNSRKKDPKRKSFKQRRSSIRVLIKLQAFDYCFSVRTRKKSREIWFSSLAEKGLSVFRATFCFGPDSEKLKLWFWLKRAEMCSLSANLLLPTRLKPPYSDDRSNSSSSLYVANRRSKRKNQSIVPVSNFVFYQFDRFDIFLRKIQCDLADLLFIQYLFPAIISILHFLFPFSSKKKNKIFFLDMKLCFCFWIISNRNLSFEP